MSLKNKTIYPTYPLEISKDWLEKHFTPNNDHLKLSVEKSMDSRGQYLFLFLFLSYKYLGRFGTISRSPEEILSHLLTFVQLCDDDIDSLETYDHSRQYNRYQNDIKEHLNINNFNKSKCENLAISIAETKSFSIDIINGTIEKLIKTNIELPKYDLIEDVCLKAKKKLEAIIFEKIYNRMKKPEKVTILKDVLVYISGRTTGWNLLKREPTNITVNNVKDHIEHLNWLKRIQPRKSVYSEIATVKLDSIYEESINNHFSRIVRFSEIKKVAITSIVISKSLQLYLDDLVDIFIKLMSNLENQARQDLIEYRASRIEDASYLIETFEKVLNVYKKQKNNLQRMSKINSVIKDDVDSLSEKCCDFNAYSKIGHLHFFEKRYKKHASLYLSILDHIRPYSVHGSCNTISMYNYFKKIGKNVVKELIEYEQDEFDKKWITGKWRNFVVTKKNHINIKRFELYIMFKLSQGLKSREIYIPDSIKYSDFRDLLVSTSIFETYKPEYCSSVGIPRGEQEFLKHIKQTLDNACYKAELHLSGSEGAKIVNNKIKLPKIRAKEPPKEVEKLDQIIMEQTQETSLLDIIGKIFRSLNLASFFKVPKNTNEEEFYVKLISTIFCYGCNLNATEAERAIVDVNRRAIGAVNANHISIDIIERCSASVVNVYNKFQLPMHWGDGSHVSVDGTKWELYSKNLMAEYHVRYQGYGGIAYYHVSDKYIAIYSNFISCGVYEGNYLLDGLEQNITDINPEFIHGDTHAQSLVIFALAYLLGIKVMPRIRDLNDLAYFKPNTTDNYNDIDFLFKDRVINWKLISNNYQDMLRVAVSVRYGNVKASDILRRIGANTSGNTLYKAFRELGRALRTTYIMNYISDPDVISTVHSATCKSEEFNDFVNWVAFADNKIRQNNRHNQRKFIKYNELVANMVMLYNVQEMSSIIKSEKAKGHNIADEVLGVFSPYRKGHILRIGTFKVDLEKFDSYSKKWAYEID